MFFGKLDVAASHGTLGYFVCDFEWEFRSLIAVDLGKRWYTSLCYAVRVCGHAEHGTGVECCADSYLGVITYECAEEGEVCFFSGAYFEIFICEVFLDTNRSVGVFHV